MPDYRFSQAMAEGPQSPLRQSLFRCTTDSPSACIVFCDHSRHEPVHQRTLVPTHNLPVKPSMLNFACGSLLTNGPGTMQLTSCPVHSSAYMLGSRSSKQNLLANMATSPQAIDQAEITCCRDTYSREASFVNMWLSCVQLQQVAPSSG